jgi:hypothetical protein
MALRCKAGDIAITVAGPRVGRVVEVIRFLGKANSPIENPGEDYWGIEYRGSPFADTGEWWIARDSYMLPIRPGDLDETEETQKELERTEA